MSVLNAEQSSHLDPPANGQAVNLLDRIVRGLYFWINNFGNSIGQLCLLSSHQSNSLACQMDGARGSHGLSAEGTKDKVKRRKGVPLEVWARRVQDFNVLDEDWEEMKTFCHIGETLRQQGGRRSDGSREVSSCCGKWESALHCLFSMCLYLCAELGQSSDKSI